jgi:hypothetical protein
MMRHGGGTSLPVVLVVALKKPIFCASDAADFATDAVCANSGVCINTSKKQPIPKSVRANNAHLTKGFSPGAGGVFFKVMRPVYAAVYAA